MSSDESPRQVTGRFALGAARDLPRCPQVIVWLHAADLRLAWDPILTLQAEEACSCNGLRRTKEVCARCWRAGGRRRPRVRKCVPAAGTGLSGQYCSQNGRCRPGKACSAHRCQ